MSDQQTFGFVSDEQKKNLPRIPRRRPTGRAVVRCKLTLMGLGQRPLFSLAQKRSVGQPLEQTDLSEITVGFAGCMTHMCEMIREAQRGELKNEEAVNTKMLLVRAQQMFAEVVERLCAHESRLYHRHEQPGTRHIDWTPDRDEGELAVLATKDEPEDPDVVRRGSIGIKRRGDPS